ncbi:MAG: ribosome small subunit-dependent GTPase A [Spirochaetia bacterium]|jgi:ribosome biogenesis GTPase|nr:ribosome small subunit-dependent GTPase A [Spirochaetia bacterium]
MVGMITRGINNIFSAKCEGTVYSCRIKGKQLEAVSGEYNPLSVGDLVEFTVTGTQEGLVTRRLPRRNCFQRWNVKGQCNQTVVANMDLLVCVCSCGVPPFRPRFIDRVIASSQGIPVIIVLNKMELDMTEQEQERLELFGRLGYPVFRTSALEERGIEELSDYLRGKLAAFVGQSGVGKSTLVNVLLGSGQRTGDVSLKYNRGRHTTNYALLLEQGDLHIVDTPGVRELIVPHRDPIEIANSFPEFREPASRCAYDGCLHDSEPDCEVKRQVEEGLIDADRYESYLRILQSLEEQGPCWKGSTGSTSKARYKMPDKKMNQKEKIL